MLNRPVMGNSLKFDLSFFRQSENGKMMMSLLVIFFGTEFIKDNSKIYRNV